MGTAQLSKTAWESPLKMEFGYAPNEADCFYAADRNFRRWLRANVNHLMTGWSEELHDQPGFLTFCMYAQLQFLDHMMGVAKLVAGNEFSKFIGEFHADKEQTHQEYEDNDNSSIEWGDERAKASSPTKHIMFFMNSEFRQPDYPEQWFMLMFTNREQSSDDTASWFAPERRGPSWEWDRRKNCFRDMRAVGRHMEREVAAACKELKEFWAEYEKQYPLSEEPQEWRG